MINVDLIDLKISIFANFVRVIYILVIFMNKYYVHTLKTFSHTLLLVRSIFTQLFRTQLLYTFTTVFQIFEM